MADRIHCGLPVSAFVIASSTFRSPIFKPLRARLVFGSTTRAVFFDLRSVLATIGFAHLQWELSGPGHKLLRPETAEPEEGRAGSVHPLPRCCAFRGRY